jgi:thiosulfate/3-mercaptopyruvate sulfurtransferase
MLDGGLAGWIAAGLPVSSDELRKPAAGDWSPKGYRAAMVAGSADVQRASESKSTTLVDGRDAANYYGITKRPFVNSYGHIAGAKLMSPDAVFRPANGALYFLSKSEYTTLARLIGIDAGQPVIAYCNSGNLASIPWFVMSEMVGNPKTSLYDGSLYLWSRESRPLVGVIK